MLTREQLLAAVDASSKPAEPFRLHVPELGGGVCIKRWDGAERESFDEDWERYRREQNGDEKNFRNYEPFLASHVLCDEGGRLLFGDDDVIQLKRLPAAALARILAAARKVNGLGLVEIEELAKN